MNKGFSLIEVLVFTAVLGLFFVAALSVATFNLKNMKIQEHKILATRYAEEGVEWVKQEKEDDWTEFIARGSAGGTTYCLNSLDWNNLPVPCDYSLGTIYKRELVIKSSGDAVLTVYWEDMGTVLSVPIKTVFKLLE
jgi:prepilin-type N-terminal cleavage/methylation domain-containing protein